MKTRSDFIVGIYQKYGYPDLLRQTPGQSGIWKNIRFVINDFSIPCDILVVLNKFSEEVEADCGEAWLIIQEPPIKHLPWVFEGHDPFDRVYSPNCPDGGKNCISSHGALPWHVEKNYDELKVLGCQHKSKPVSWITSNKRILPGHRKRMSFLDRLRQSGIEIDLFGYGFNPIRDKYEGLADYRYSLSIENYRGKYYWSEKVADCFLSWTMPIYCGCLNLGDYFPRESFVQIDIEDTNVFKRINEVVSSDLYLKKRDAIAEARNLILDKYQLFPFIANEIEKSNGMSTRKHKTFYPYRESLKGKVQRIMQRFYAS